METGVCYFPDHWPRERWETDVAEMAAAGVEYVRMGEFSWAVLEPDRGAFAFDWLETAVDLVHDRGLRAVLCTPTATPPKWLVDERPRIRQADPDGTPREWGSRRFTCFTSPAYREETERIVAALADRFADHPGVADDLDFLAWDSYPTGFVQDRRPGDPTPAELRAGDPDQVSLNHDLYRGVEGEPFWVMEQQPGDVNWPPYAPQPAAGAVTVEGR